MRDCVDFMRQIAIWEPKEEREDTEQPTPIRSLLDLAKLGDSDVITDGWRGWGWHFKKKGSHNGTTFKTHA
jgi:hypothetical protein